MDRDANRDVIGYEQVIDNLRVALDAMGFAAPDRDAILLFSILTWDEEVGKTGKDEGQD